MNAHSLLLKIKRLDSQMIAVMLATPMAAALLAYLISIGATDLVCANWFVSMIAMPAFLSTQISAFGHLGRIRDIYSSRGFHYSPLELVGALTGVTIGLFFAAIFALQCIQVPLLSHLGFAAYILFAGRQLNIFAGIGSRLGRSADTNSRPFNEKVIVGIGATVGLALSITLFATSTAAMVTVVGVTAFFTAGVAVPVWIAAVIFIASITSAFISNADYGSKAYNYIRTLIDKNCDVAKRVKRYKAEYSGSLLGLCIGALLGLITAISLAIATPYILPGAVGIITVALIIATTASLVATVFSQVGRVIDNFRAPAPVPVKPLDKATIMFLLNEQNEAEQEQEMASSRRNTLSESTEMSTLINNRSALFQTYPRSTTCEKTSDLITSSNQKKSTPKAKHGFKTPQYTSALTHS